MLSRPSARTWLTFAAIAIVAYVLLGRFVRYAVLPLAVALAGFIVYRIAVSELGRRGVRRTPRTARPRRDVRPPAPSTLRFDPNEKLTVPKDWR